MAFNPEIIEAFKIFPLAADIQLGQFLPDLSQSLRIRHWSLYFYSKDFIEQHPDMIIANF